VVESLLANDNSIGVVTFLTNEMAVNRAAIAVNGVGIAGKSDSGNTKIKLEVRQGKGVASDVTEFTGVVEAEGRTNFSPISSGEFESLTKAIELGVLGSSGNSHLVVISSHGDEGAVEGDHVSGGAFTEVVKANGLFSRGLREKEGVLGVDGHVGVARALSEGEGLTPAGAFVSFVDSTNETGSCVGSVGATETKNTLLCGIIGGESCEINLSDASTVSDSDRGLTGGSGVITPSLIAGSVGPVIGTGNLSSKGFGEDGMGVVEAENEKPGINGRFSSDNNTGDT